MQEKGLDFKHKEVINISDGRRLGYVQDVCADLETGNITHIIVPGSGNKLMNIFKTNNEISIPWKNVKCIGEDLILVELWKEPLGPGPNGPDFFLKEKRNPKRDSS